MIRAILVSIVFLGIVLTLLILQPTPGQSPPTAYLPELDEPAVSRAEIELDALESLSDSLSNIAQEVEKQPRTELLTSTLGSALQPAPHQQPAAAVSPDNPSKGDTGLEQLVIKALQQGQSDTYIDALVNDAAQKGSVEVPPALITPDGRVDTGSLLSVLSTPASVEPEFAGMGRSYVVQPGDSLASISYRFFGRTAHAMDIFDANREQLTSPNHVEIGQRLIIPEI